MTIKRLSGVVNVAIMLALVVVMLGAYTRLTDAGLGCPDWPGCYGHLVVQQQASHEDAALSNAAENSSAASIDELEPRKAWTEMVHRYAAGTLALFIFFIGTTVLFSRSLTPHRLLPILLMGLVIFQALLGMWTVTLKLLPIVVMSHLLGGILIFSLLVCLRFQLSDSKLIATVDLSGWRLGIGFAAVLVLCQIALGGWVSANYAGISCIGFPQCNGAWVPTLHFAEGFNLYSPVGQNYQGGVLENAIRVTIQWIHRLGAVVTMSYLLVLAGFLIKNVQYLIVRRLALVIVLLSITQFMLGIINVLYRLPLTVAVAHNGVAAVLMATVLSLLCLAFSRKVVA